MNDDWVRLSNEQEATNVAKKGKQVQEHEEHKLD